MSVQVAQTEGAGQWLVLRLDFTLTLIKALERKRKDATPDPFDRDRREVPGVLEDIDAKLQDLSDQRDPKPVDHMPNFTDPLGALGALAAKATTGNIMASLFMLIMSARFWSCDIDMNQLAASLVDVITTSGASQEDRDRAALLALTIDWRTGQKARK